MKNEKNNKIKELKAKEHPSLFSIKQKWVFRILLSFVVLFFSLQIIMYFWGTPILRTTIQRTIFNESGGLYSVDFEEISVNISTRSFILRNFRLKPDTALYRQLKQQQKAKRALYEINFKSFSINDIHLWDLFWHQKLKIENIKLDRPLIRLIGIPTKKKKKKKYDGLHEDLYPTLSKYVKSLQIGYIKIHEGYFDLFIDQTSNKQASVVNNINIILTNFYLDEKEYIEKQRLFYSDYISVNINNYRMQLSDSIHILRAGRVLISTKNTEIYLKKIRLMPDPIRNKELIPSKYFEVYVPEIHITDVNIRDVYFDKIVDISSFELSSPTLAITRVEKATWTTQRKKIKRKNIVLYKLIEDKLKELAIDTFRISNASFNFYEDIANKNALYGAKKLFIEFDIFELDSAAAYDKEKIFYADDISFSVDSFQMQMADKLHRIKAQKVHVSTKKSLLEANGFVMYPMVTNEYALINEKNLYRVSVPRLELKEINLHKAFNEKYLPVTYFNVYSPKVKVSRYLQKTSETDTIAKIKKRKNFYALFENYIGLIKIYDFKIINGTFDFENYVNQNKEGFSSGEMSLQLRNFKLDTDIETERAAKNDIFYTDELKFSFRNYQMKIPNDFHIFKMKNFEISTFDNTFAIEGMSLKPDTTLGRKNLMQKYQKTAFIDAYIDKITAKNADIHQAYFNKILKVDTITINRYRISYSLYPQKITRDYFYSQADSSLNKGAFLVIEKTALSDTIETTESLTLKVIDYISADSFDNTFVKMKDTLDDFKNDPVIVFNDTIIKQNFEELLLQSFSLIDVKLLDMVNGQIKMTNFDTLLAPKMSLNNKIDIRFNQFRFDSAAVANKNNLFYAKDIEMQLTDYNAFLPDGVHVLKFDRLAISTLNKEIYARSMLLYPNHFQANKLKKQKYYEVYLPEFRMTGINFNDFFINKNLNIQNILLYQPEIILVDRPHYSSNQLKTTPKKEKTINISAFNLLNIENLMLINGYFTKQVHTQYDTIEALSTNMSGKISQISFSDSLLKTPKLFDVKNIAMNISDFHLELKDSIHYIDIEKMEVSTEMKELYINNLTFAADTTKDFSEQLYEKDKVNTFEVKIPQINFKGIDIEKIYTEKYLIAKEAKISKPSIGVERYLYFQRQKKSIKNLDLYTPISKNLNYLSIDDLYFNNANLDISSYKKLKTKNLQLNELSGHLTGFEIDSLRNTKPHKFYYSDNVEISLKNYQFYSKDSLYAYSTNKISLSMADSTLKIKGFSMYPTVSHDEFAIQKSKEKFDTAKSDTLQIFQTGVMQINGKSIVLKRFDIKRLIEEKEFDARSVEFNRFFLNVFKDRRLIRDTSKIRDLPAQIIMQIPFYTRIDTLKMNDWYFDYHDRAEKSSEIGVLTIENLNIEINNLTNDPKRLKQNDELKIQVNANIMGTGKFKTVFKYYINSPINEYIYSGTLSNMQLSDLNSYLRHSEGIVIEDGKLNFLSFKVKANDTVAVGSMRFRYNDLKISFLDKQTEDYYKARKGIISMLANSVIRSDNPKRNGFIPRTGKIYTRREPSKLFFSFWIKALLSGIKSTVFRDNKELKKYRKEEQRILQLKLDLNKNKEKEQNRENEKARKKELRNEEKKRKKLNYQWENEQK